LGSLTEQFGGTLNETVHRLQAVLDAQIGRSGIHNVVAAVQSMDRSVDFVGASGVADPRTGKAMTPETPYFIASVTKMHTAAIALRLHAEKRLELGASIVEYLPDSLTRAIHLYRGTDYSDRIKVSDLIAQTSGLADHEAEKPKDGTSVLDELKAGHDRAVDTEEALDIVRTLSPHFAPGTPGKSHYSNANYRLLGAVIESVTRKPMTANFTEMIVAPLGLQHTYLYDHTAPRLDEVPATIYLKSAPAIVPKYLSSNVSDGGLVSTAAECLVFLRAFFEGQLFDKALFARMTKWNRMFFPLQYGYGLMYFRLPRFFWPRPLPEFVGHSGSTGSFAFASPSRSMYIAGTVNQIASPSRPFFLMIGLVRAAAGRR
jgi:CubicO group peptidase (beta-lactamase class C family)